MTYIPSSMPQPGIDQAIEMAERLGFASVVVNMDGQFYTSHVPVHIARDESGQFQGLRFHVAKRNPLATRLQGGPEALIIFRGPDGYISPDWYDHENVPTWDYAFVHMTGPTVALSTESLRDHVKELLHQFDPQLVIREGYIDTYLSWIQGFAIPAPTVEPVFKLSQDKNQVSVDRILAELRRRGQWLDQELADEIERQYKPHD